MAYKICLSSRAAFILTTRAPAVILPPASHPHLLLPPFPGLCQDHPGAGSYDIGLGGGWLTFGDTVRFPFLLRLPLQLVAYSPNLIVVYRHYEHKHLLVVVDNDICTLHTVLLAWCAVVTTTYNDYVCVAVTTLATRLANHRFHRHHPPPRGICQPIVV